jgi:hypothetical protein
MTSTHARIALGFILVFGFCARASTYRSPLLDHHAWRQADTAAIARNFYREEFNLLRPQIDWRGARTDGYVETGLELPAFVVAALSRVAGFRIETGRLVSSLAFLASTAFLWSFVRRRDGQPAAAIAAFVYAFGLPLMLFMERAFMNEAVLVCLSIAALAATQIFLDTRRPAALAAALLATALVGAIKLPYLIVLAPIAGLFVERRGLAGLRSPALALVTLAALAIAALWYSHAHRLGAATGLTFGLTTKVLDFELAFSSDYVSRLARRAVRDLLGPVGLVAGAAGLWIAIRHRRWCEIGGVVGFAIYLVLVPAGNFAHDYYQLTLMPIAPVLIARGLTAMHRHLGRRGDVALAATLMVVVLSTFVRLASAHSWFYYAPGDIDFCARAAALGDSAERVVIIAKEADPKFLFCMDRKGWVLTDEIAPSHLRLVLSEGARTVFVLRSLDAPALRAVLDEAATRLDLGGVFDTYRVR